MTRAFDVTHPMTARSSSSSSSPSWVRQLGLPALSGSLAVCFSHPLELTKARLQVDLELARHGERPRAYAGWMDCVAKNWRANGIRGLQAGLQLGIIREFFFNGIRLGCFEPLIDMVQNTTGSKGKAPPSASEKLAAGLTAGALGGLLINPVDVLKTRAQISGGESGYQHSPRLGFASAAAAMIREEGAAGLVRGVGVNTLRGILGPGSQVTAYSLLKEHAGRLSGNTLGASDVATHVTCSLLSAAVSVAFVNPVDVLRTRLYNQPFGTGGVGLRYSGGIDAAAKLLRAEGPFAFYKGAGAHFARLGPHMLFVFVIFEQLKMRV